MNQHLERTDGLAPFLRFPVLKLIELCQKKLGVKLMIVHGFRSVQEQMFIYQRGRRFDRESGAWTVEDQTKLVTMAKPGTSPHNVVDYMGKASAMAVDLIGLDPATGQPDWTPEELFCDDLYELAWRVGLDPLGDPTGAYLAADKMHFEEPAWKMKLEGLGLVLPAPALTQVT